MTSFSAAIYIYSIATKFSQYKVFIDILEMFMRKGANILKKFHSYPRVAVYRQWNMQPLVIDCCRKGPIKSLLNINGRPLNRTYSTISQTEPASVDISSDKKIIELSVAGDHAPFLSSYHAVWLRHHCACPKCKNPNSGRPLMPPENLLKSYTFKEVAVSGKNLIVSWEEESDHQGVYPLSWLVENAYGEEKVQKLAREARPKALLGRHSEFSFETITISEEVRLDWMLKTVEDGFAVVKQVPSVDDAVMTLGNLIFELRGNLYGNGVSSIMAKDTLTEAGDQSYSTLELEYHQDVPYYESSPGFQLIHCFKRSSCVTGGESSLIDIMSLAEDFRNKNPEDFDILTKVPIRLGVQFDNLHFLNRPRVQFQRERPLITVGAGNEVTAVIWDPGTELPLCTAKELIEPYYRARHNFLKLLMTTPKKQEFILKEGSLLVFNNRRMVHRRKGFQLNGGVRHLRLGYVNVDEFKSEVYSLCNKLGRRIPLTRVGDNNITF